MVEAVDAHHVMTRAIEHDVVAYFVGTDVGGLAVAIEFEPGDDFADHDFSIPCLHHPKNHVLSVSVGMRLSSLKRGWLGNMSQPANVERYANMNGGCFSFSWFSVVDLFIRPARS